MGVLRRNWHRMLVLLSFWLAAAASAQVTCSVASIDVLSFGSVDPASSQTDASANIHYSCNNNSGGNAYNGAVCFGFTGPASGSGALQMTDGSGHVLSFHAYTDPARTAGWGNTTASSINAQFSTSTKGQWTLNPAVIYGRVDAGQTSAVPGSYSYASNAITMAVNFVKSTAGSPSDCQGLALNPTTQTLTATASVVQTCTVSTTTLNFGTPGLLNANVDGTSTITTQCASGTAYQIGLDNGLHASGTTRQMAGGSSELIAYELYRDSSRTQRWGNTLNSDTVSISGTANTGAALTTTVYGRVAAQSTPSPSSYSDTITVTVTY